MLVKSNSLKQLLKRGGKDKRNEWNVKKDINDCPVCGDGADDGSDDSVCGRKGK